jgi:hypothetical protein
MVFVPGASFSISISSRSAKQASASSSKNGFFNRAQNRLKLIQHRSGIEDALGQEVLCSNCLLIDANNVLHSDLHLALVQRGLATNPYKIVLFETAAQVIGSLPDVAFNLAALIEKLQYQVAIAVFGDAVSLSGDKKQRIHGLIVANICRVEDFHSISLA